jgi:hypothetical protein
MTHFTGYGAYALFLALRTHFTKEKYDFFINRGKLNTTKDAYMKRHDKHFFEKIAKRYGATELKDFFVANLLEDRHYILEMTEDDGEKAFQEFLARRQSFTYKFAHEIDILFSKGIKEGFAVPTNRYPLIIEQHLSNLLPCDSLVVLDDMFGFADRFDKYLGEDDIVWSKIRLKMAKYRPFLKYDRDKIKTILREKINEQASR